MLDPFVCDGISRELATQKLQELIRRGTPKDLAAAQELMKVMSGAVSARSLSLVCGCRRADTIVWLVQEPEKRPDYEQQVQKELDRIQQRILLLNEMLNNAKPKERFVEGDAFDVSAPRLDSATTVPQSLTRSILQQIAQKCRHVQPKIQNWIAESAENDPGAMGELETALSRRAS